MKRKDEKKNAIIAIFVVCVLIGFLTFNSIQAIGAKKYYGKDYMILNTTEVLSNILKNPDANFSYDGADSDLKSIEVVIPVEILKEYGMNGFRCYNWTQGHKDFNQTLVSDSQAEAYMSAYYHIILNNLDIYFDVQINCFYNALGLPTMRTSWTYSGDSWVELDGFEYNLWTIGRDEVYDTIFTEEWSNNVFRIRVSSVIGEFCTVWREIINNSGINSMAHVLAFIGIVV